MSHTQTTRQINTLIYSDKDRGTLYNGIAATGADAVGALRAIREIRTEARKKQAQIEAEIADLKGQLNHFTRAESRCDEAALDILREQREIHGPMTEVGMYKIDLNDGTNVSLLVRPSESVEVDAGVVDQLPDEFVKVVRTPRLDIIKGQLKTGWEHPGVRLIVKAYKTDPPASEDVQWRP